MICYSCSREMKETLGCTRTTQLLTTGTCKTEPFGSEPWYTGGNRCRFCFTLKGYPHHLGCRFEMCPVCKTVLVSCGCTDFGEDEGAF